MIRRTSGIPSRWMRLRPAAFGSIMTTFMIEGKKTRQRLKSEPKGPSERDAQIYELHKSGEDGSRIGGAVRIVRVGDTGNLLANE